MSGPRGAALEIKHLAKAFLGVHALADVSFSVEPGELVGLIGPNGSGKSTALDCVCGQQSADTGEVLLDGARLSRLGPYRLARQGVARTFQDARVFDTLTVIDNLVFAAMGAMSGARRWRSLVTPPRRSYAVLRAELDGPLGALGIAHLGQARVGELSYGQRKLVDFAAVCVQRPRLLILDEPVAAVSPVVTETIMAWLRELHTAGVTILLVEHNLELIQNICDRVVVLDGGRKIADGDPHDVMTSGEVHAAYFGI